MIVVNEFSVSTLTNSVRNCFIRELKPGPVFCEFMFSGCLETQPASSLLPHTPHPSPGFLRATKCHCCSGRGGWIRNVTSSPREKPPMACSFSTPRSSHSSQNPKPLIEEPALISCQPPGERSVLWYNVYSRQRKGFSEEQAGSRQTPQPEEETGDMGAGIEVTVGHLCGENMTNAMIPLGLAYGGNSRSFPYTQLWMSQTAWRSGSLPRLFFLHYFTLLHISKVHGVYSLGFF